MSFRRAPIPWKTHCAWFDERLERRERFRIYIGEVEGKAVGQVRFERVRPGVALISVVVARGARGRGVGTALVRQGCRRVFRELALKRIVAWVKRSNPVSVTLFGRAGFLRVRAIRREGVRSILLSLRP